MALGDVALGDVALGDVTLDGLERKVFNPSIGSDGSDLFSSLVTFPFILAIGGGLPEEGLLGRDLSEEDLLVRDLSEEGLSEEDSGTGVDVDFDIDTSDEIRLETDCVGELGGDIFDDMLEVVDDLLTEDILGAMGI